MKKMFFNLLELKWLVKLFFIKTNTMPYNLCFRNIINVEIFKTKLRLFLDKAYYLMDDFLIF